MRWRLGLAGSALLVTAALGLFGSASPALAYVEPTDTLSYTYVFPIGYPLDPGAGRVAQMAMHNFSAYFPFGGCGSVLRVGQICGLDGNPIRVDALTGNSFTFRSLPGHKEGANRMITFTFEEGTGQFAGRLYLRVHARGVWSLAANTTIIAGTARAIWNSYASTLTTAILRGDWQPYSTGWAPGPDAFESGAVARNADGRLEAVAARQGDGSVADVWQTTANGVWSGGGSLGGGTWSGPTLGANADGRLEVFTIGADYSLWHRWQQLGGGWSNWASLGKPNDQLMYPVVGRNGDGRLEVFAVGTSGGLYHIWQNGPNGGWGGWGALGGIVLGQPAVALNANGRLELFVLDTSLGLDHIWQTSAGGGWSGWARLGSWTFTSDPAVGRNADGRLEVFVVGTDAALDHIWQNAPNCCWSGFAGFGGTVAGTPAVGRTVDGSRLEVFVAGRNDGSLQHIWELVGSGWSGWAGLGGILASVPMVGNNADGRPEVFHVGMDGDLFHAWQTPSGSWTGWNRLLS